MEEISRGCASLRRDHEREQLALLRPGLRSSAPRSRSRSSSRPSRRGEKLGCFGLTEPDERLRRAARMKTVAEQRGRRRTSSTARRTGSPTAPQADAIIVFAMTDQEPGQQGHHRLPRADRHARLQPARKPDEKLGIRAAHSCTIFFEDMQRAGEERPRQGGRRASRSRWPRSTAGASASPRRRSASRAPRYEKARRLLEGAQGLRQADRATTRPSSSCSPTWRPSSTPRAC